MDAVNIKAYVNIYLEDINHAESKYRCRCIPIAQHELREKPHPSDMVYMRNDTWKIKYNVDCASPALTFAFESAILREFSFVYFLSQFKYS